MEAYFAGYVLFPVGPVAGSGRSVSVFHVLYPVFESYDLMWVRKIRGPYRT